MPFFLHEKLTTHYDELKQLWHTLTWPLKIPRIWQNDNPPWQAEATSLSEPSLQIQSRAFSTLVLSTTCPLLGQMWLPLSRAVLPPPPCAAALVEAIHQYAPTFSSSFSSYSSFYPRPAPLQFPTSDCHHTLESVKVTRKSSTVLLKVGELAKSYCKLDKYWDNS